MLACTDAKHLLGAYDTIMEITEDISFKRCKTTVMYQINGANNSAK